MARGAATDAARIDDLLPAAVDRRPDADAIVAGPLRWSYRTLFELVRTGGEVLGPLLRASAPRVAIVGANHPAYVLAYFAAHALGASTVEIGRDESLDAIARALALAAPDVVVTDRADLRSAATAPVLEFDAFLDACGARPARPGPAIPRAGAATEASVVFTSGTTGDPKGVVLSHGNILFVVHAVRAYLRLVPQDRYAIVLPLSHTYGKSTLLSAVAAGAASVLMPAFTDAGRFFGALAAERCTVLSVVPFHLNVIARRGLPEGCDLGALRAITSSGGPLPWETVDAIGRLLPDVRLVPMFGLTESSTRATYLPPELLAAKRGSVGQPLPGVRLEVRDAAGRTLPAGAEGRLFVRGPNVMQGYLGDAELTARTLVDGWLDTGDVGRLDEDGFLFITGREKEIIKVAGERIGPAEVEAAVAAHPGVADAAVVGEPDPLLGETVVAYVVPRGDAGVPADLGAFCAARLSHHRIPRRFVRVERIPRTPTGKIRRHLLTGGSSSWTRRVSDGT